MADLTRISISLEENLLEAFDKLITAKETKLIRTYLDERRKQTLQE